MYNRSKTAKLSGAWSPKVVTPMTATAREEGGGGEGGGNGGEGEGKGGGGGWKGGGAE